ncbi:MAG TPA: hypothetical protein VK849_04080 [Longimicrobiales bacterium]|nr:hypothetical protein [Longimicrobiales bacterium]
MTAGNREPRAPALVLGTGQTALGVVRILGRAGIPLYVTSSDRGPIRWSRWCRAAPRTHPGDRPDDLPAYLEALGLDAGVLIPCSDDSARAVACLPPELGARFPASLSTPDTLASFTDKGRLSALLERYGVPHPRTVVVDGALDARDALAGLEGEAFIKPRNSQAFFARFGVKGFWVKEAADLSGRLDELSSAGFAVVVQEYLPGGASAHYFIDGFVDRSGTVRALFARRRMRMYPIDFGNSTAMRTVPVEDVREAADALGRLLTGTGYRGIFSAEFMEDERDGRLKLLEVNTRAWWFVEFAARCGVDVVSMAYRDALGEPVDTIDRYDVGRRLVFPYYDSRACAHLVREGELAWGDMLRSWLGADGVYFARDDPAPALASLALTGSRVFRGRLRRAVRARPRSTAAP